MRPKLAQTSILELKLPGRPLYNLISVVLKKRLDLPFKTSPDFRARIVEVPGYG